MYSCSWDWDSIFETGKRRNHSSISKYTTAPEEDSDTSNKNVLALSKYQVSLNLAFGIKSSKNYYIFVWSGKKRGER